MAGAEYCVPAAAAMWHAGAERSNAPATKPKYYQATSQAPTRVILERDCGLIYN